MSEYLLGSLVPPTSPPANGYHPEITTSLLDSYFSSIILPGSSEPFGETSRKPNQSRLTIAFNIKALDSSTGHGRPTGCDSADSPSRTLRLRARTRRRWLYARAHDGRLLR